MIISFANQKGGVGKTTSTYAVASELAKNKKKVLMIDLDPQNSLTILVGLEPYDYEENKTICGLLLDPKRDTHEAIIHLKDNLDIITSRIELASVEVQLISKRKTETFLKRVLAQVDDDYDYILIDCPPQLSTLAMNAFECTNYVIIPCQTDYLAYRGIDRLIGTVKELNEDSEVKTEVLGVLATMFNSRSSDDKEVLKLLKEKYNVIGVVKRTVTAKKGMYEGNSFVDIFSKSEITEEYKKIVKLILSLNTVK